jgi:hypothetical protein
MMLKNCRIARSKSFYEIIKFTQAILQFPQSLFLAAELHAIAFRLLLENGQVRDCFLSKYRPSVGVIDLMAFLLIKHKGETS